MEIRKSYLEMIRSFPGGWDSMPPALGFSRDALENRIYERKGQGILVQTALQLQAFSGTQLFARAVATATGGTFLALPPVELLDQDVLTQKWHELYSRLGQLSTVFTSATADSEIDSRERAELEAIGQEMHRTIAELFALMFRVYCRDDVASRSGK